MSDLPQDSSGHSGSNTAMESFYDLVRTYNPFLVNRVDRPSIADSNDVFGIHEMEFRRLLSLTRQALADHRGIGVCLCGEAGTGKSHLLARMARWASQRRKALFVYLPSHQVNPDSVARSVLETALAALTTGQSAPSHHSPLFGLINTVLRRALAARGLQKGTWGQLLEAYDDVTRRMSDFVPSSSPQLDRTIYDVLFVYYQAAHPARRGKRRAKAELALRWLSGEVLPADDQVQLEIQMSRGETSSSTQEKLHVRRVFAALTQFAKFGNRTFVLAFDQLHNSDDRQVRSIVPFLHDLLDSVGNTVVVTAAVREDLVGLLKSGAIPESSWDRVGQVEINLGRISKARGREILWARLQPILECVRGLPEIQRRIALDPLFPLGTAWFEQRAENSADFRPRDILRWAAQRWQQHQSALTTTPGDIWLSRLCENSAETPCELPVQNEPHVTVLERSNDTKMYGDANSGPGLFDANPPSADRMKEMVNVLLEQVMSAESAPALTEVQTFPDPVTGEQSPYDLVVRRHSYTEQRQITFGIRFLATSEAQTAAFALQSLVADMNPPDRVILVTDVRLPLPENAECRHLVEMMQRRSDVEFERVELSNREAFELSALFLAQCRRRKFRSSDDKHRSHNDTSMNLLRSLTNPERLKSHRLLAKLLGDSLSDGSIPTGNLHPR